MVARQKRRKKINVELARRGRARGMSYAEIGRILGVSPTGVYYALKPRARSRHEARLREPSRTFSVRLAEGEWALLEAWAQEGDVSRGTVVRSLISREAEFRASQTSILEREDQAIRD